METSGRGSRQTGAIETPVVSTVLTSARTSESGKHVLFDGFL